MSLQDFTRAVGQKIGPMGGAFMMNPTTGAYGDNIGLDFFSFYALGRGGVLGDVDGAAAADAFFFFNPDLVQGVWDAARQKMPPREAAEHYADACAIWGRANLSDIPAIEDFTKLAERVAQAARPTPSSVLFAGWREMPLPDDAPGRAAVQLTLVLREMRGGAHVEAVKQVELSPMEAVVVNSPNMLPLFGWQVEAPDAQPLKARAEQAESLTDEIVGPAFDALDEGERETFAAVVDAVAAKLGI